MREIVEGDIFGHRKCVSNFLTFQRFVPLRTIDRGNVELFDSRDVFRHGQAMGWIGTGRQLTPEEEQLALDLILQGNSLDEVARAIGFSSRLAFYDYRKRHPIFDKAVHDTRVACCDHMEDNIMGIIEDYPNPHQARVKLDAITRTLAYRNPNRYGPKLDMNINQTVDIGSELLRLQSRLDASYRDVTPQLQKPNDSDDLW